MRKLLLFALICGVCRPAFGQMGFPQFPQRGIGMSPMDFILPPGQTRQVAAYCGNLLADTPSHRDRYTPDAGAGKVLFADGRQMALREAVQAGLLQMRGRGPLDPRRPAGVLWVDFYLVNRSAVPMRVAMPAGAVFRPEGDKRDVPQVRPLAAALNDAGAGGSDIACYATWVATGSTRADLEHTLVRLLSDDEVQQVNEALDASGAGAKVKEGRDEYTDLYDKALKELGAEVTLRKKDLRLSGGAAATLTVTRGPEKRGVAQLRTRAGDVLSYGAEVTDAQNGEWRVTLIHLKTGKPVQGAPQYGL